MINEKMTLLGQKRSVIREIFEYGKKRCAEIGAENVFDFSLGNPSVPAPACVNETISRLLTEKSPIALHGYTSAQGDFSVRSAIAGYINKTYGVPMSPDGIYMTAGAAASLCITLNALCASPDDEFITFTPFFPEYRVFTEAAGGKLVACRSNPDSFQIDFDCFAAALNEKTKGVIINSPNNPSGVVISEDNIKRLALMLEEKQTEYGHPIYLITDEPYRELVYGSVFVPYVMNYYDNTIVCYSFSKSLSIPGERIGYIALSPTLCDERIVYAAVCGAGRALGYVCAPVLFQYVAAACLGAVSDLSVYKKNRDLLYDNLCKMGFSCVNPDGAFYLFVKSPEPDAYAFFERAKKHELLFVPADSFGTKGYVRIAYCVSTKQITRSLPAFEALAKEYFA